MGQKKGTARKRDSKKGQQEKGTEKEEEKKR